MNWIFEFPEDPWLIPVRGRGVLFRRAKPFPVMLNGTLFVLSDDPKETTDGASIPPPGNAIVPSVDGIVLMPALWHDNGYKYHGIVPDAAGVVHTFNREELDEQFRDATAACGATKLEQEAFFIGLRAGGWIAWNRTAPPTAEFGNAAFLDDQAKVDFAIQDYYGVHRSSSWPAFEKQMIAEDKVCQWCGTVNKLQVHHIKPFHLHPELEEVRANVITLCMSPGKECHFERGHNGTSWLDFNLQIKEQCNQRPK